MPVETTFFILPIYVADAKSTTIFM